MAFWSDLEEALGIGTDGWRPHHILLEVEQLRLEVSANRDGLSTTVDGVLVRKLYVSNLPTSVTENDLYNKFQSYGKVRDVSIVKKHLNAHSSFAFVTFESPKDATSALDQRRHIHIHGRKLHVSPADSWHQPVQLENGEIVWNRKARNMMQPEQVSDANDEEQDAEAEEDLEEQESLPDNDNCPISRLNDDCLLLIFNYLTLIDQLPLVNVCRRWKALSTSMWSNVKTLDFSSGQLENLSLDDKLLHDFVSLCSNLTSITIISNNLSTEALIIIARNCKKLERITMQDIKLKTRSLAFLARSCPNLKSFYASACINFTDSEMISLIKSSQNLEEVALKYSFKPSGTWLSLMRPPLKSLSLHTYQFKPHHLLKGIKSISETLKKLAIVSCESLTARDLKTIIETVPELTSLQLSCDSRDFGVPSALMPITNLKMLTSLFLNENCLVSNTFLRSLADNCVHLQYLSISCFITSEISESGLEEISKLSELTHLTLVDCKEVTDSVLLILAQNLKKLKMLQVIGCSNVTDAGCNCVTTHSKDLEILDVSECPSVTNGIVFAAFEKRKDSRQKKSLQIIAGGTKVDLYLECSPFIELKERFELEGVTNISGFGFNLYNTPLANLIYTELHDIFDELTDSDVSDFEVDYDDCYCDYDYGDNSCDDDY